MRPHFRKDPKKEENAHKLRFPETLQNIETNTSDLASHRFRKFLTNKFFIIDLKEKMMCAGINQKLVEVYLSLQVNFVY